MIFLELFLTFFKVGLFTFGGGYAMIPVVEGEVVPKWITSEMFTNFIAVAESTPGPVAINTATFIGASQGSVYGFWGTLFGAMCATAGVVLPSFIIILLIATVMKSIMRYSGVKAFLAGIRPVVCGLIIATGISMVVKVFFNVEVYGDAFSFDYKALIIFCLIVAVHTIYKFIRKKTLSPIILIIISAVLGMVFYGLIP